MMNRIFDIKEERNDNNKDKLLGGSINILLSDFPAINNYEKEAIL